MPAVGYDHVERDAPTRTHEAVRSHAYISTSLSRRTLCPMANRPLRMTVP